MACNLRVNENTPLNEPYLDFMKGEIIMPEGRIIRLQPMECSLYRLFLAHPEGIKANEIKHHRNELFRIYKTNSRFGDKETHRKVLDSLCGESKIPFYVYVSRIKRKFEKSIGCRNSTKYIIQRNKSGKYKVKACILIINII